MTVPFGRFNEEIIAALAGNRERIEGQALLSKQAARMMEEGGHLLRLLPVHFVFDQREGAALAAAASSLLDAQTRILRHFAATIGREGILRAFNVPPDMRRFVNWKELLDPELIVGRFDILQSQDGYRFCEFNIDSCVAAAEIFEFADAYLHELGVNVRDDSKIAPPLSQLAALVARVARRRNAARVVILDWSVGGGSPGKGYLSFDRARGHISRAIEAVPVLIADEKSYRSEWLTAEEAPRTLVIRGYMMDEMDDGGEFLERLISQGTPIYSTYESEIRMNKIWFAFLHDSVLSRLLTEEERELIVRYVPYTCEIDDRNRARLIADKDRYIFKRKQSFGGQGIREGAAISTEDLDALLKGDKAREWVSQELLNTLSAAFPSDDTFRLEAQNLVFGMYFYGLRGEAGRVEARANGMLVRASTRSRIVNVTAGDAKLAWAFCVDEAMKATIAAVLKEAKRVGA